MDYINNNDLENLLKNLRQQSLNKKTNTNNEPKKSSQKKNETIFDNILNNSKTNTNQKDDSLYGNTINFSNTKQDEPLNLNGNNNSSVKDVLDNLLKNIQNQNNNNNNTNITPKSENPKSKETPTSNSKTDTPSNTNNNKNVNNSGTQQLLTDLLNNLKQTSNNNNSTQNIPGKNDSKNDNPATSKKTDKQDSLNLLKNVLNADFVYKNGSSYVSGNFSQIKNITYTSDNKINTFEINNEKYTVKYDSKNNIDTISSLYSDGTGMILHYKTKNGKSYIFQRDDISYVKSGDKAGLMKKVETKYSSKSVVSSTKTFYYTDGKWQNNSYSYYPDGTLKYRYSETSDTTTIEYYDINGNKYNSKEIKTDADGNVIKEKTLTYGEIDTRNGVLAGKYGFDTTKTAITDNNGAVTGYRIERTTVGTNEKVIWTTDVKGNWVSTIRDDTADGKFGYAVQGNIGDCYALTTGYILQDAGINFRETGTLETLPDGSIKVILKDSDYDKYLTTGYAKETTKEYIIPQSELRADSIKIGNVDYKLLQGDTDARAIEIAIMRYEAEKQYGGNFDDIKDSIRGEINDGGTAQKAIALLLGQEGLSRFNMVSLSERLKGSLENADYARLNDTAASKSQSPFTVTYSNGYKQYYLKDVNNNEIEIIPSHAYQITDYDESKGTVVLINPHNKEKITFKIKDIGSYFLFEGVNENPNV